MRGARSFVFYIYMYVYKLKSNRIVYTLNYTLCVCVNTTAALRLLYHPRPRVKILLLSYMHISVSTIFLSFFLFFLSVFLSPLVRRNTRYFTKTSSPPGGTGVWIGNPSRVVFSKANLVRATSRPDRRRTHSNRIRTRSNLQRLF